MKKILFIAIISVMTFLACSKQDSLQMIDLSIPLSIKAGISIEPNTKAIVSGAAFQDGASIGVQVLNNSNGGVYEAGALTNIQFTYSSATSNWSSPGFYLTSTSGKVCAYYPYLTQGTNDALFTTIPATIPAIANTGLDIDYMYATPLTDEGVLVSNATGKNSATLTFNHALAQISFVVYKDNYPGLGNFSQFTIEDAAGGTNWIIVNKATGDDLAMNISSGAITGGEKGIIDRTLTVPCTLLTTPPSLDEAVLRSQVNATTLVAPTVGMGAGGIKFTFTIDGKLYTVVNTSALSWEPAKQYIYKVKLSGTDLSISSVTVTDWTTIVGDDIVIN